MRLYFLLEDSRSFYDTLPSWLSMLHPEYRHVPEINRVQGENCYIIKSGCGYPRLLGVDPHSTSRNVLGATITDINRFQNIDRLVVIFDADDASVGKRYREAITAIKSYPGGLCCSFNIFLVNHCFETWLLGNRAIYPTEGQITPDFRPYHEYFNVSARDPEKMYRPRDYLTTSIFHFEYLRRLLQTQKILYSKRNPGGICNRRYFEELQKRVRAVRPDGKPERHLDSLRRFFDFLETL